VNRYLAADRERGLQVVSLGEAGDRREVGGKRAAIDDLSLKQYFETVKRETEVRLLAPQGADGFFDAFFGCVILGAVPVPLYPPTRLGLPCLPTATTAPWPPRAMAPPWAFCAPSGGRVAWPGFTPEKLALPCRALG